MKKCWRCNYENEHLRLVTGACPKCAREMAEEMIARGHAPKEEHLRELVRFTQINPLKSRMMSRKVKKFLACL